MSIRSVLCVFAHPDDETILAGGILALLHTQGVQTHLICATSGEGGEIGDPPIVEDRRELGAARGEELRCAAEALGVSTLTLLGYVDPDIGPGEELRPFEAHFPTLVQQIAQLITERKTEAVLTHGPDGEYGHPAHRLLYQAARKAVVQHHPQALLYSVAATVPGHEDHLWNASRTAHLALNITPWAEAKIAAMECHVSQHALFKRRRKLQTVREALRRIESVHREWPPVHDGPPDDAFAALLRAAGAQDVEN